MQSQIEMQRLDRGWTCTSDSSNGTSTSPARGQRSARCQPGGGALHRSTQPASRSRVHRAQVQLLVPTDASFCPQTPGPTSGPTDTSQPALLRPSLEVLEPVCPQPEASDPGAVAALLRSLAGPSMASPADRSACDRTPAKAKHS